MIPTCSQCEQQIAGALAVTVIMGNDLYVFWKPQLGKTFFAAEVKKIEGAAESAE
jgi:hypothetical protein